MSLWRNPFSFFTNLISGAEHKAPNQYALVLSFSFFKYDSISLCLASCACLCMTRGVFSVPPVPALPDSDQVMSSADSHPDKAQESAPPQSKPRPSLHSLAKATADAESNSRPTRKAALILQALKPPRATYQLDRTVALADLTRTIEAYPFDLRITKRELDNKRILVKPGPQTTTVALPGGTARPYLLSDRFSSAEPGSASIYQKR